MCRLDDRKSDKESTIAESGQIEAGGVGEAIDKSGEYAFCGAAIQRVISKSAKAKLIWLSWRNKGNNHGWCNALDPPPLQLSPLRSELEAGFQPW